MIELDEKRNGKIYWNCYCACDEGQPERKIHSICGKYLKDGSTASCGCLKSEHLAKVRDKPKNFPSKDEYTKPFYNPLKNIWGTLIGRCHNPNYKGYKNYGAKGVYVCDLWRNDFWSFYAWSIEHNYQEGLSIDRINRDKNYEPDNCEWNTVSINCGDTERATLITIKGKTQSASAWAKDPECEVNAATILNRYRKKKVKGKALLKKRPVLKEQRTEIDGQIKTFEEWAQIAGISLNGFITRWRNGKRGRDLIKPSKRNQIA